MSYTINPNAKNKWARNADNTMDLSLETDASSVYLDNGRTLEQEIGEGSMVSNVATVDTSMSKVVDGTLDGAYESGVMYGKTMVNGLSNPKIQQGREYITMVSPTHLIINHGENLSEKKISVNYDWFGGKMEDGVDYTLDIWILKNTMHRKTDPNATIGKFNFNNYNTGFYGIPANTLGHITYEVTTSNVNTGGKPYIETFTTCEGELEIQIVIRQGKNLVPIEQHFEGICDVKMPILRNTGKNLFDMSMVETNSGTRFQWNTVISENSIRSTRCGDTINGEFGAFIRIGNVKPSTTYTLTYEPYINNVYSNVYTYIYNNSTIWGESLAAGSNGTIKFTTKSNTEYITIGLNYGVCSLNTVYETRNIQLEESPTSTTYEPYKSNILRTSEEVVLRSLPNGVCDTYNVCTGEYTQRVGEKTYTSTNVSAWWKNTNTSTPEEQQGWVTRINGRKFSNSINDKGYCNSLLFTTQTEIQESSPKNYTVAFDGWNENMFIMLPKSVAETTELFQTYLQSNPITVQYELAEPITTIVESLTTPFAYENGHIILESGYEGQSLLPTLEYSTVVNKTGQIENVAKTIQRQEKQLTMLEKMLIQNIINLDYNNTLLTLKNEMEEML